MPKTQEKSLILRPSLLFQTSNSDLIILTTNSEKQLWIKEEDWESVEIDKIESYRDGGTTTYYLNFVSKFSGKVYKELFIPSPWRSKYELLKLPYIDGETSSGVYFKKDLDETLLSQQTLHEIGITEHLKLDMTNIPESHTSEQHKDHAAKQKEERSKCLTQFFRKPNDDPFEALFLEAEASIKSDIFS